MRRPGPHLIPALDDGPDADEESERLAPLDAAVEHGAVLQAAGVVAMHDVCVLRLPVAASRLQHLCIKQTST